MHRGSSVPSYARRSGSRLPPLDCSRLSSCSDASVIGETPKKKKSTRSFSISALTNTRESCASNLPDCQDSGGMPTPSSAIRRRRMSRHEQFLSVSPDMGQRGLPARASTSVEEMPEVSSLRCLQPRAKTYTNLEEIPPASSSNCLPHRAKTCSNLESPASSSTAEVGAFPSLITPSTNRTHSSRSSKKPSPLGRTTSEKTSRSSLLSPGMAPTPTPSTISRAGSEWSIESATEACEEASVGRWRKGQKIGCGSYGTVYKALDLDNGRVFAVKRTAVEDDDLDKAYTDKFEHELKICQDLRHPNIVSYLGHQYLDSHLYIYLEYVSGGSMASVLKEFGPIQGALLSRATRGMLDGLDYLHTRSPPVVHRDIKCANVLVDLNFCVKLADFGCSKRHDVTKSFTTIGSIPWMAPEVIIQQNGHGRKADIWSLGCTVIEMVSAEKPWGNVFDNIMFAMRHIGMSDALPPIPETTSTIAADFIRFCVQREVDKRPTTVELLQHAFIAGEAFK